MPKIISLFCALTFATISVAPPAQAGKISHTQLTRPAGSEPWQAEKAELIKLGEKLWHDKTLSKNNKTSCAGCHKSNKKMFKKTFLQPYPHSVKMAAKKANMDPISAEGMVQFCMLVPMKARILPWDSLELAALTAYTEDVVQKAYIAYKTK